MLYLDVHIYMHAHICLYNKYYNLYLFVLGQNNWKYTNMALNVHVSTTLKNITTCIFFCLLQKLKKKNPEYFFP